jgi:excinuclease ABC subunit C
MKDRRGSIFYIGKAKDLRARMGTYLGAGSGDDRYFTRLLSRILRDVDFILTANEKEALLLESELVKRHQPRFNVLLRDDKSFLHLRVRSASPYPRIEVVRRRKSDGARYFGPFDSARSIRNTLHIINQHFGLRTCSDGDFRARTRPCLEHQIGRCPAPCVLDVDREAYERSLRDAMLFLDGRAGQLVRRLRRRMEGAAAEMAFEQAARHRDQIRAIERTLERQDVVLGRDEDIDVIALAWEGERAAFEVARYREGYPFGSRSHRAPGTAGDAPAAAMSSFLHQLYERLSDLPREVLVNIEPEMLEALREVLSARAGRSVRLRVPKRGPKRALVRAATRNARQRLSESERDHRRRMDTLARVQARLRLRSFPQRIEGFDISNISGSDAVGSMVVFSEGLPDQAGYRRFSIRTVIGSDDYAMMAEMLVRRFRDAESLGPLPDLVVIDGGKAHLRAVLSALDAAGLGPVEAVALAKERSEVQLRARRGVPTGDIDPFARRPERVYLPDAKDPVLLRPRDATTHLLAHLRDEAHRFAITYHRSRRRRRTVRSALDEIAGVGPKRRAALLSTFGSVEGLRGVEAETMAERAGVPLAVAQAVAEFFAVCPT